MSVKGVCRTVVGEVVEPVSVTSTCSGVVTPIWLGYVY